MGKLNFDDMNKVAGGKGEYKVKPVDGGFEVTKMFDDENEAKEYAEQRNKMHSHPRRCKPCGCHPPHPHSQP